MAQQNDRLARSLIDPSGREVSWALVFQGVKNIVKTNNLNNDTLTCIKGWLKSNDNQLHIPLLALTVLHTISLNCGTVVRNQMAAPKLFQRLEKQLARPQGPQVVTALVQILVDWTYLFSQEELGHRSQALLDQPRHRQMAAGCTPSAAVLAMQEEMQLGVPAVAPIRGEDFIRWMYRGAPAPVMGAPPTLSSPAGASGGAAATVPMTVQSGALPGGAPPPIITPAVPELCKRMQADAERLTAALSCCRAAVRTGRQTDLTAAMDAAYREAERCSQWRRRVQDYTQSTDEPPGLSAVLAATDVINSALQAWQQFTGQEVYGLMRIHVPPMPPGLRRPRTSPRTSAPASQPPLPTTSRPQQPADLLMDLLNIGQPGPATGPATGAVGVATAAASVPLGQHQNGTGSGSAHPPPSRAVPQLPTPSGNPFALGQSGGAAVGGVTASAPSGRKPQSEWDPFDVAPAPAPAPTPRPGAPPASSFAAVTTDAAAAATLWGFAQQDSGAPAAGPPWPRGTSSDPFSPNLSAQLPSTGLWSPSEASTASTTSSTRPASTTGGPAASSVGQLPNGHPPASGGAAGASFSGRSTGYGNGAALTPPPLEWQPEYDRLASELRSLCTAQSNGSGAIGRGADVASLLPEVLARVRRMCEALAAQHASQVAALASAAPSPHSPHPPSPSGTTLAHPTRSGPGGPLKLREVASASAISGAGAGAAEAGPGLHGNGAAAASGAGGAGGSWLGFAAGSTRPPVVGPLQQHLLQHQQHPHPQPQQHPTPYPPSAAQQHLQPPRPNGVAANPYRAAGEEPPSLI